MVLFQQQGPHPWTGRATCSCNDLDRAVTEFYLALPSPPGSLLQSQPQLFDLDRLLGLLQLPGPVHTMYKNVSRDSVLCPHS